METTRLESSLNVPPKVTVHRIFALYRWLFDLSPFLPRILAPVIGLPCLLLLLFCPLEGSGRLRVLVFQGAALCERVRQVLSEGVIEDVRRGVVREIEENGYLKA